MNSFKRNAFTYATIVAMGGFVFGLDAALISGTISYLIAEFGLNDWQLGTAVSAPGLGVLIALPIAGYAANALGRKNTLIIIAALYLISAIGSAFATSYEMLVAARFLGGLAFSSITLSAMYIGEIAPPQLRGKLVSMTQINIVIGLSAAYFINYLIQGGTGSDAAWVAEWGIKEHTWRWMLGSEILFALLWFVLLFFVPKSPSWLMVQQREDDARATLSKIYPASDIEHEIMEIKNDLAKTDADRSIMTQLREVFSAKYRTIFIVALTIAIAQQSTGINAIMFYAPTVIEQIGLGTDAAFMQAIWFGLVSVVFTVLSLMLIDKIGRRPMILWGMIWIVASLGICSYGFHNARYTVTEAAIAEMTEIPEASRLSSMIDVEYQSDIEFKEAINNAIGEEDGRTHSALLIQKSASMNGMLIFLGILSFIAAFHFSVGPIMWVLFSEIFPHSMRGVGIPVFALVTSVVSWAVQKFFPAQLASMGSTWIFLFYAATVFVGLLILWRYLPETKGLSIEEIQAKITRD